MKIEFVDYDGCWPNLCSGTLILRIDGELYAFGGYLTDKEDKHYPKFWTSGGTCGFDDEWNDYIESGDWLLFDEEDLPDFLKPHAQELIDLFNAHVPQGCCGGCL